jgi:hypothetical protein
MPADLSRGSGTLQAVALVAASALLGSSAIAISSALVHAAAAQAVANQASLAASDVARGIVPGIPCRVARALVAEAGFSLGRCEISGGEAAVVVQGQWWGLEVSKRARAAPPPHPVFGGGG